MSMLNKFDIFICHASEDKETLVRPIASELIKYGVKTFFDEISLAWGDSLSRSIDKGLTNCRFGLVILSKAFFKKNWPRWELDGLVQRQINEKNIILPLWHEVTAEEVRQFSPSLSDIIALKTDIGINTIVQKILERLSIERTSMNAVDPILDSNSSQTSILDPALLKLKNQLILLCQNFNVDSSEKFIDSIDDIIAIFIQSINLANVNLFIELIDIFITKLFVRHNDRLDLPAIFEDVFKRAYEIRKMFIGKLLKHFDIILFRIVFELNPEPDNSIVFNLIPDFIIAMIEIFYDTPEVVDDCFTVLYYANSDRFDPQLFAKQLLIILSLIKQNYPNEKINEYKDDLAQIETWAHEAEVYGLVIDAYDILKEKKEYQADLPIVKQMCVYIAENALKELIEGKNELLEEKKSLKKEQINKKNSIEDDESKVIKNVLNQTYKVIRLYKSFLGE